VTEGRELAARRGQGPGLVQRDGGRDRGCEGQGLAAIMEIPSGLPPGVDIKDVPPLAKALFGVKPDGEMQGQMASSYWRTNLPVPAGITTRWL
jgi:hypothetical protein